MPRPLKVYGWQGWRTSAPGSQTREICAAESAAAVARANGAQYPYQLFNLCETGNAEEIRVAMALPGMVFWRGLDTHPDVPGGDHHWTQG